MTAAEGDLRPVDLARAAGVSTQQVRNYEDAGILPPAPRTPAGYRRFGPRHLRALLTYRAMVKGYGPISAHAIMLAVHSGEVDRALALVDAAHAALHEQRLSLAAAGEALQALAGRPADTAPPARSALRIGEVAAHLGVRTSALRVWEAAGLLTPRREPGTSYRHYGPTDVRDARLIHLLRQSRYPLPRIRPVLDDLRRTGGSDALRAAIARQHADLARRTTAMLDGAGHLHRYLAEQSAVDGGGPAAAPSHPASTAARRPEAP
ncbi:MerR family transcriptional regulator [Marinitenerispora sediminis]|uniref:MerR family transcriptional regulator n=1 Tax=Marinitenerispora sediminis TaxID=1931232 RepID=A0A368T9Z8_9ACTN|nr:MerR family transcriptional regulator [Marinitenerispora sediminis]RCV52907.1 MerR family transcriptional regulator [Marinitenerispora sediminis]RCV60724.1 MerR family transcriptional regulator [Marinitenerispora sediminis]RCV61586.1 MerR family transcriptional regulator [Marinitenerispora sediminis]